MSWRNAAARLVMVAGAGYLNVHVTLWEPALGFLLWLVLIYVAARPLLALPMERQAELDECSADAAGVLLGSREFVDEVHEPLWEARR